ncbi:MAG: hypothetical protein RJA09_2579 [Pseudomonadota bacterium]|jgi:flagella basal body P-ring formation protein FlgA
MPTHRSPTRTNIWHATGWWLWFLVMVAALAAQAVYANEPPPTAPWTRQAEDWIHAQLAGADGPQGAGVLRPEVVIGTLDSRLKLAPCARVEPYMPTRTQLWGRTRIGLKCVEGPVAWNVFLPITVKAWGPAWQIRRPVTSGTALTAADVEPTEVDWALSPTPVLARESDWLGREATRPLLPGQVLRQAMVRAPQAFAAGDQIKVVLTGGGFQLSASGQALTHGVAGQDARIRLQGGKVVTGTVQDDQTVLINL